MKLDNLVAIDTHVHIEPEPTGNAADEAARKYFGNSGRQLRPQGTGRVLPLAQDRLRRLLGRRAAHRTSAGSQR